MSKIYIYPSILSADFSRLGEEIRTVEKAGADGIHLDIMDGHFVPNLTIGPVVVQWLRRVSKLPYWAHLMIENPSRFLEPFRDAGVNGITIHFEVNQKIEELLQKIRGMGLGAGISLKPETSFEKILSFIPMIDRVLILTVPPGFGGQPLIPEVLEKIKALRHFLQSRANRPLIEVDGGIGKDTVTEVVKAGADVLIIGNAIFGHPQKKKAVYTLKKLAKKALNEMEWENHNSKR